jgi:hypothetical protein
MTFSKKVPTQGSGSSASNGDWDTYNKHVWDAFDVDAIKDAKGRLVKSGDIIGILNYIQELGNQPLAPFSMKSNVPVPSGDEEHSAEELARLEKFPNNWYEWVEEYDKGKQVRVRKIFWNQDPQETLVLGVDFPDIQVDYNSHPASEEEGEHFKPFRIDYNGKFKNAFERQVSNEVNWKTNKFGDKDIKYKITTACGTLQDYQESGHDIAYLVQATCNWEVVMTCNENDGKTYYNIKIKNPTAIQDVKTRKEVYTVAEQIEDSKCDIPFTGIFFNTDDASHYSKEQLQQVRGFWWDEAKKAVQIDKNEGSNRSGTWLKGINWEDSSLYTAYKKFGFDVAPASGGNTTSKSTAQSSSQANAAPKKVEVSVSTPTKVDDVDVDFDDDIPF